LYDRLLFYLYLYFILLLFIFIFLHLYQHLLFFYLLRFFSRRARHQSHFYKDRAGDPDRAMERSAFCAQGRYPRPPARTSSHLRWGHQVHWCCSLLTRRWASIAELLGEARIGLRSLFVTSADGGEKWLTLKKYCVSCMCRASCEPPTDLALRLCVCPTGGQWVGVTAARPADSSSSTSSSTRPSSLTYVGRHPLHYRWPVRSVCACGEMD
jgi:hypothetical protein